MKSREHIKYPDGVDILVSKIMVWEPASKNVIELNPDEKKCLVIREVLSVDISESFKKLISTADIKFPRGTVVKRTITEEDDEKGKSAVFTERLKDGAIVERRADYSIATPEHFKVGQRIRVYLGYYRENNVQFSSESERLRIMEAEAFSKGPVFDGYITKCSASTPITLHCENLASALKDKTCKPVKIEKAKINDLLADDGKYKLLEGTGLSLHPYTKECDIEIGAIKITEDLTIADLLSGWSKYKLFCYIRNDDQGIPRLQVGRSYFSSKTKESLINYDNDDKFGKLIQFDYHVASDDLKSINSDPRLLAVEAQSCDKNNNFRRVTIRLNREWTGPTDTEHEKFQILNKTELDKKSMRLKSKIKATAQNKVDLSQYTVIPFISSRIDISAEDLIKEAEAYFDSYNMNGVEGSVTIFGDYQLQSGQKVELLDIRHPEKNGWYIAEEVSTHFGTDGYRQTLKLPYCISKPEKEE